MKAYLAYSYSNREEHKDLDSKLSDMLEKDFSIDACSFVFDFPHKVSPKELMKEAFKEIDKCKLLIAEFSHQSPGVALEAGYAKAKGAKVIVLYKEGAEKSETMEGIANLVVEYSKTEVVLKIIKNFLKNH